jgi:hypothetical protein
MATVWVWIVILTVGITLSVCPFNRMAHTANKGHLTVATRIFKHLKRTREKWIFIDLEDLVHSGELTRKYKKGKTIDSDPGAAEELDPKFPAGLMKELDTSLYYNSNFAHDKETRRSVAGILGMVGSTPVLGFSK